MSDTKLECPLCFGTGHECRPCNGTGQVVTTDPVEALIGALFAIAEDYLPGTSGQVKRKRLIEAADTLSRQRDELAAKDAQIAAMSREADDVDRLIKGLGLAVEDCRTESGLLNVPRVITRISEMRVDAAIQARIAAALAPDAQKETI